MLNDKYRMAIAAVVALAAFAPLTTVSGCPELDPTDRPNYGGPDKEPDEITIGPSGKDMSYFRCAKEHQPCNVSGARYMAFGANNHYLFRALRGSTEPIQCSPATFGGDPAPGVEKSCYFSNYGGPSGSEALAAEGAVATANGSVAYGANGSFYFKRILGQFKCNNETFGNPTPDAGKACYSAAPLFTRVAAEHETMNGLDHTPVAYGAAWGFKYRILSGTKKCDSDTFGGDPAVGQTKDCYTLTDGGFSATNPISGSLSYVAYEHDSWTMDSSSHRLLVFYGSGRNGNFMVATPSTDGKTPVTCDNWLRDADFDHTKHCWAAAVVRR